MGILEIPHPSSLAQVEAETRSVNLRVLVIGAVADDFLQEVHDSLSGRLPADERTLDLTMADEASITYVPIRLGDLKGWKTRVHFYGFRDDPRLLEHLTDYTPDIDGVLLATGTKKGVDGLSKKLAASLKSKKSDLPVIVWGKADAAKQWSSAAGYQPQQVIQPADGEQMSAVKALAGKMLGRLKKL